MSPRSLTTRLTLALLLSCSAVAVAGTTLEVTGRVLEQGTQTAIPFVTVQAEGTSKATLSNEQGQYRILVDRYQANLKFSHIAYHPKWVVIPAGDSSVQLDVELEPSALEGDSLVVTARALDPGRRIMGEAIRRNRDIFERLQDYSYDAYAKLVVTGYTDTSQDIFMLTET